MTPTIKDVPMLTHDEVEIQLNSVLYTTEWTSGYRFEKEGEFKIVAHRVISVNNTSRHFRTRCKDGCEAEHHYAKGCNRIQLYGSLDGAKKALHESMARDTEKVLEKIAQARLTSAHIARQRDALDKVKAVKIPKAVKA